MKILNPKSITLNICILINALFSGFAVQQSFAQCVDYEVHACIDVIDFLHVQGNQMWWVHQGGSNPGQHSSCSGDVLSVNGTPWGSWNVPFTLAGVTACMDVTSVVILNSNITTLVQAPNGSNGWETIYKFDDSGPSAAHPYKVKFTFCPTTIVPTLTFTVSAPACAGNVITFTYTGTASTSATFSWDFGDGTPPSTVQSPTHIYATAGNYNVSLDVTDCNVHAGPTVVSIPVSAPPSSTFTFTSPACIGANTTFSYTGSGLPGDTYIWNFGGGTIVSGTGQGPYQVNWATQGTKIITLSVDENGCVSPLTTDSIIVSPVPIATFIPPSGQCEGSNNFSFTAGGNFIPGCTFVWSFANASIDTSLVQNPSGVVFSSTGYHTVTMNFVKNGCVSNTYVDSVKIYTMPFADFGSADVCLHLPMSFADSSIVAGDTISGWLWNFADGTPSGTTQTISHTFLNPGTFPVSLICTTTKGCKDTIVQNVIVHPLPKAKYTATNVCDGDNVLFASNSTLAPPDVIQTYAWNFGDNSSVSTTQTTSHLYAAVGSYVVQLVVVSDFGCSDSISKTSIVHPNPVAKFTVNDTSGCAPLCVSFTDSSSVVAGSINYYILHWAWSVGDGSAVGTSKDFEHCYTNTSIDSVEYFTVSLTVTTDSGCVATVSKNNLITVYPNPKAEFSASPESTEYTDPLISVTNTSVGATLWNWDFDDMDTSFIANPLPHSYKDTGTYTITLIASTQYGCRDTTNHKITIEPEFLFYIPNAFSPDGDHTNETFSGKGLFISEYNMSIFDRWGNLIYFTDTINLPWDGKANHDSEIAMRDVYIYSFKIIDVKKKKHNYIGTVTLVR